ncbi:MAG: ABC transporter ATP-binding protein [Anaerolineales bacterium]|uniref:ABC transporter ATP-binding protein n=1 Tax=Candidatus Desulfolinea nitratireducens TaxID=2841698 RepID=A0A8J6NK81_9CHLR|nr:ABC transporter ATP-binding protein [Candidatus Desulfolinea nitratireducens]MBL6961484.1 ABC transporter ATP-binding protein [Anaerolineales bacterium]
MQENNDRPILEISNLRTYFHTEDGIVKAVDDVNFHVNAGEIVGLVGESGCGKTVTSLSIIGLVSAPGKVEGKIDFNGRDLLKLSTKEISEIRGNQISMIFQQPQSSLNPVLTVGDQITEVLHIHQDIEKEDAWDKAIEMLRLVGIPSPEKKVHAYPHEMSGGQAQRVMIAMALILNPSLLIADEPTTALDVTIQAQILDLMRGLNKEMNTAIILITHDLGVIADMVSWVAVMYAGKIVEQTSVADLYAEPLHPYTQGLIGSIPILGRKKHRLDVIPGVVPNLVDLPAGCAFASRCNRKLEICEEKMPELIVQKPRHEVRCWLYQE